MNETHVTIVGNVATDPVRRRTTTGLPFLTFRVASTVRRPAPDGGGRYVDGATSYYSVCAFRSLAVNLDASLAKGQPVIVTGRLRINEWTSGDKSGWTAEIDAAHVGHNLALGTAEFRKSARTGLSFGDDGDRLSDPAVQAIHTGADDEFVDLETGEVYDSGPLVRDAEPGLAAAV